jgi:hypothetical protein
MKGENHITQQRDDNHSHTVADADPYEQPNQT